MLSSSSRSCAQYFRRRAVADIIQMQARYRSLSEVFRCVNFQRSSDLSYNLLSQQQLTYSVSFGEFKFSVHCKIELCALSEGNCLRFHLVQLCMREKRLLVCSTYDEYRKTLGQLCEKSIRLALRSRCDYRSWVVKASD